MKIMPVAKYNSNYDFNTQKEKQNFGMSLSIGKNTDDFIRKAVQKREIDPISWLSAAYNMSIDSAHYNIIKKSGGGFFGFSPQIVITRVKDGEEPQAVTAEISNFLEKTLSLDGSLREKVWLTANNITHNMLDNIRYISSGKETITVEARKMNILDDLTSK